MNKIPKFEIPNIPPQTELSDATKIVINAMVEHYNKYIVAKED